MYLEHFGLREAPFRVTPHTEFFFSGGNRGATLDALIYAITHDEGIVKVSGEVGSGKTMLCRALLERLPERVTTVYLANPSLSREEILFVIADGLGLQLPDGRTHQLIRLLQERLTEIRSAGKQVIVLIDEAHAMPGEALEEICRLSNLELGNRKLLQFVLVGQPDLDLHLLQPNMRQLKERVTHNFALEPLKGNDIGGYLMFRMRAAGYQGPDIFTPEAIQIIARASEGLTRRINVLADKALLTAASHGAHQVDLRDARTAVGDAQFGPLPGSRTPQAVWAGAGGLAAASLAAYLLLWPAAGTEPPSASAIQQPATQPAPTPPATIAEKPSETAPESAPSAVAAPATAATAAATESAPPTAPTPDAAATLGPLTQSRLAASEAWLRETPGKRHFIQLLNTDTRNADAVETFLARYKAALDASQLRVYRSALSGRDRLGVIYGDYATPEEAAAAMNTLPESLQEARPFIRTVDKLR